eukprot:TRINITY_DN15583_c0_g5_i2.p1 TRINITY_DN15583_c0_g5~~TRINITY_DN15583_c0_g5_i2.p1  ORF type:complete len:495 (-),score=131.59 TRINITY_DN15583_c0_g5_i2:113-1597(-)
MEKKKDESFKNADKEFKQNANSGREAASGAHLTSSNTIELDEDFELKQMKADQDDDDFDYCFDSANPPPPKKLQTDYNRLLTLIKESKGKKSTTEAQSVIFEEDDESSVYFGVSSPAEKNAMPTIAKLIDEELQSVCGIGKVKGSVREEKEKERRRQEIEAEKVRIKVKAERLKESATGGMITNNLAMKAKAFAVGKTLNKEESKLDTKPNSKRTGQTNAKTEVQKEQPKEPTVYQVDDWDKVNQQRRIEEEMNEDAIASLTHSKVWDTLRFQDLSKEMATIVREDTRYFNAVKRFYINFIKPVKLDDSLALERDTVLALMKVEASSDFHWVMLEKIQRLISVYAPKEVEKDWVLVGFQGSSPQTDIRGTGMFGVFQIHFFAETYPLLTKRYFLLSIDEKHGFPLAVMMFGFTAMAAETLREGRLTAMCNKGKSVVKVVNLFYAASICVFMEKWIKEKLTIVSRHRAFTEVSKYCKNNAEKIIINFLKTNKANT